MTSAGEALQAAAVTVLAAVEGIGRVYDAPPIQSALPYALVAIDGETDWSHKSGAGREVRLAATVYDKGERPVRLRRLAREAEAALAGIGPGLDSWRLVSLVFVRARIVGTAKSSWAAVIEHRARLLAD
jgi:hypothetical protein